MRRFISAFLACLMLASPADALRGSKKAVVLGRVAPLYANLTSGNIPSWLSYASAGLRYYFDASGNLQTSPNNLILNSAVFATQTVAVTSGASYVLSATMASGNSIAVTGGATTTLSGTGAGSRVYTSFVASSASATLTLTGTATQAQLELVTAAQTTPNPYMPTNGSAYFGPVVNDHNPSTLAAHGIRSEPQRTNWLRNGSMVGAVAGVARSISGISSISRTASTSAVILASTTNAAVGDILTISGATPSTYNGVWVVTAATAGVSITVTTATSATDSASGYAVTAVSPGTLPTNYSSAPSNGLAYSVVAVGTTNGLPSLDLRVAGVPTATQGALIFVSMEQSTQIAASPGQSWNDSAYFSLVGGSTANISSLQLRLRANLIGGGSNGDVATSILGVTSASASTQRFFAYSSSLPANTDWVTPFVAVAYTSGQPIDITLRIAAPQIETGAFATSPILTYGTSVTVPADNWSFTGAARAQLLSGRACLAVQAQAEGSGAVNARLWDLDDGTTNNTINGYFATGNMTTPGLLMTTGGVAQTSPAIVAGGDITAAPRTTVAAWSPGVYSGSYDGGATMTSSVAVPTGMANAVLGNALFASRPSYGWFQQIMIRPSCTAAQVQRYSTAGANLQAANDNEWPMFAANDNLPVIVKIASGEW